MTKKHFVALVGSFRRRGNSETLARLACKIAEKTGTISTEAVFFKDFKIEQCNGCMKCVFRNIRCPINDDFYPFAEKIKQANFLFLVAPTYVLSIPGSLKIFIDRFLTLPEYQDQIYGRPAVSVGVAGLAGWESLQLPMLNLLLLTMGFNIQDSFIAYGAGPGEVLLNKKTIERLEKDIDSLINYRLKALKSQVTNACPICYSTVFERLAPGKWRCPVCAVVAEEQDNGLYFNKIELNNHRWTKENIKIHFEDWIKKTKPRFIGNLKKISERINELKINE